MKLQLHSGPPARQPRWGPRSAGDASPLTMYFDSLVFTAEGLRHLVAECGASQIVLGTDFPFPWTTTAVDHVLGMPGLSDGDKEAILGRTLKELLRIE